MTKYGQKSFFKIPGGEIQYGHITGSIVVWFRGKKYRVWTTRKMKKFKETGEL